MEPPDLLESLVKKYLRFLHQFKSEEEKLSCRPMLEFVCLLYTYKLIVSDKVKHHRIIELKDLFLKECSKKIFFTGNELIKSNYEFACKVISEFF